MEFTVPAKIASEGITQIAITSAIDAANVKVSIAVISSENVTSKAEDNISVYSYFNITSDLKENEIKNASVNFDVSQKWINSSNLDKDSVKLKRYKENWTDLKTEKISEDSVKVSYKSESPGFSLFAITAEKIKPVNVTTETTPASKKSKTWLWILLALAMVILIIFVIILLKPKEKF